MQSSLAKRPPVTLVEVPATLNPGLADVGRIPVPRREDSGELTIWQVYATLTPLARSYLFQIAGNPGISVVGAMMYGGSNALKKASMEGTRKLWRQDIPGFAELEDKLRDEPILAAHFLAVVTLPKALKHFNDVLDGSRGNKSQAAMHIINVADAAARLKAKKATAKPEEDDEEQKKSARLEQYLGGED